MDCEQRAELIRAFSGAVVLRTGGAYVTDILRSLSLPAGEPKLLPALCTLHVPELTQEHVASPSGVCARKRVREVSWAECGVDKVGGWEGNFHMYSKDTRARYLRTKDSN
jgi:hypothetical protein